uniref:Uncharacterized protein n=1 Tax=Anguilla anguilla TaxID=7936 RepID=A0A0E9X3M2_ANGAN
MPYLQTIFRTPWQLTITNVNHRKQFFPCIFLNLKPLLLKLCCTPLHFISNTPDHNSHHCINLIGDIFFQIVDETINARKSF